MKIFNESGSKERFNEMFEKVAKSTINESLDSSTILELAFKDLKEKKLNVVNQKTYSTANDSYIEIIATDKDSNSITFTFKVIAEEDEQDNVFHIIDAQMTSFSFDSQDEMDSLTMEGDELSDFSNAHKNEIINSISEFVDFEQEEPAMTEEEQNAIDTIDAYDDSSENEKFIGSKFNDTLQHKLYRKLHDTYLTYLVDRSDIRNMSEFQNILIHLRDGITELFNKINNSNMSAENIQNYYQNQI